MKMKIISILAILALILGFYFLKKSPEFVHPKVTDVTEAVYGLGKVKSHKRFEVIIGVLSTVERLSVEEGDMVKKGQSLIQFESHPPVAAPFEGTVTMIRSRVGETAIPNVPILRLEDLRDRYVELALEQEAALRIRQGQVAKISFETIRGKVLQGKVTSLYSREDEFIALIDVPELDPGVLPGMTADVSVEIGKIHQATVIPVSAVSEGMVTVKRRGLWKKEAVELGHVDGLYVEVKGNSLTPADQVRIPEKK